MDKYGSSPTRLTACRRGVAAIEYALVASLIAVGILASLAMTGTKVEQQWNDVDSAMPGGTDFQS